MNWRRGLFRLWVLAGLAWSLCVVSIQWQEAEDGCSSARFFALHPECTAFQTFWRGDEACKQRRPLSPEAEAKVLAGHQAAAEQICRMEVQSAVEDTASLLALFIGVSVALLIVGTALLWGVRGFRKDAQA